MTSAQRVSSRPRTLLGPHVSPANRGHSGIHRLIVVENDPVARAMLARELCAWDFDVLAVDSSLAVGGKAAQFPGQPDAIAFAVDETNRALRGGRPRVRGDHFDAPVMYLIRRHQMAGELPGFRTGIDDYLVRPFAYADGVPADRAVGSSARRRDASGVVAGRVAGTYGGG